MELLELEKKISGLTELQSEIFENEALSSFRNA